MADIRPMDFGEILDGALVIYRRHFGLFLQLAVVTLSAPFVLLVYLGARFLDSILSPTPNLEAILLAIPVGILYYVASLVLTAGAIRIISDAYLGRVPSLREALSLGLSRLWGLAAVGLGKGVIVGMIALGIGLVSVVFAAAARGGGLAVALAFLGAIGAGCWFIVFVLCGYGLTTPVVVLERLPSALDSFRRSWDLTRGFKGKVLGVGTVAFLLTNTLPSLVLRSLGAVLTHWAPTLGLAANALSYLLPLVLAPVFAAVVTLLYYDLRVRREAFDLQMLSQQLGIV